MDTANKHTARRWTLNFVTMAFAVALALLFVLVLRSIAAQIAPPPGPLTEAYPDVSTEELCTKEGGRWLEGQNVKSALDPRTPVTVPIAEQTAYCQGPLAFERTREAQAENNRQISLFVFAIGGALAVAASLLVQALKAVAPGLMLGGIAAFFTAGFYVWILAPGIGRLVTIVVIFLVLIGIGMYTLRDEQSKK